MVLYELWYGIARSSRPEENSERLRVFLGGGVEVWALEQDDAIASGELRRVLELAGTPIGPYDLLIAGQAVRQNLTLVTAHVSEFARVPGLRWEDWS